MIVFLFFFKIVSTHQRFSSNPFGTNTGWPENLKDGLNAAPDPILVLFWHQLTILIPLTQQETTLLSGISWWAAGVYRWTWEKSSVKWWDGKTAAQNLRREDATIQTPPAESAVEANTSTSPLSFLTSRRHHHGACAPGSQHHRSLHQREVPQESPDRSPARGSVSFRWELDCNTVVFYRLCFGYEVWEEHSGRQRQSQQAVMDPWVRLYVFS